MAKRKLENTFRQHLERGDAPEPSPAQKTIRTGSIWLGKAGISVVAVAVLVVMGPYLFAHWQAENRWNEALKAYGEGRFEEAAKQFRTILETPKLSSKYRNEARDALANSLWGLADDMENAGGADPARIIALYEEVIALNPTPSATPKYPARQILMHYMFQRDVDNARRYYDPARREAGDDPAARAKVEQFVNSVERLAGANRPSGSQAP